MAETATPSLCEQCHESAAKYKCPGCLHRTCSLACSKAHKNSTECSGKRNKAEFVKRADYDANTMMSDYGFLQDLVRDHALLLRDAEEQGVSQPNQKGCTPQNRTANQSSGPPVVSLDRSQRNIVARAKNQRQVVIQYMSPGLKRHQQNKTIWVSSKSRLVWTLEIAAPEVTEQSNRWIENGFHDVCRLGDLWSRILDEHPKTIDSSSEEAPRKRARTDGVRIMLPSDDGNEYPFKSSISEELQKALRQGFGGTRVEDLTWLIRVQNLPANQPTFCKVDPRQPLFTQLRYQTVLEFPTVYVYKQVPDTWDGHTITIQEHCVENSSNGAADASYLKKDDVEAE